MELCVRNNLCQLYLCEAAQIVHKATSNNLQTSLKGYLEICQDYTKSLYWKSSFLSIPSIFMSFIHCLAQIDFEEITLETQPVDLDAVAQARELH